MRRQFLEQARVTGAGYGTDDTGKLIRRQYSKKAEADERSGFQPATGEIRMRRCNSFVEIAGVVLELAADPADEPVVERRQLAEQNYRTQLGESVRLRQPGESDIALSHGRGLRSATVYSGSSSP